MRVICALEPRADATRTGQHHIRFPLAIVEDRDSFGQRWFVFSSARPGIDPLHHCKEGALPYGEAWLCILWVSLLLSFVLFWGW